MRSLRHFLTVSAFPATLGLSAQPGTLDTSFDVGDLQGQSVQAIALQADGRMIIGGTFSSIAGTPRANLARLLPDGAVDQDFDIGSGFNSNVTALCLQPDGRVIAGGGFTQYQGQPANRLIRLNADGSRDDSFDVGGGLPTIPNTIAIQPDGRILVGGAFQGFDGGSANRIVRLLPTGERDEEFQMGTGFSGPVSGMRYLPGDSILVWGSFTQYNGTAVRQIACLDADGILLGGPVQGAGFFHQSGGGVDAVLLTDDGGYIVGGFFTQYDGQPRRNLARLDANGNLVPGFPVGNGPDSFGVRRLAFDAEGRIVAAGNWQLWGANQTSKLVRLLPDGTLDPAFTPGSGPSTEVFDMALQPDGRILIAGSFTSYAGTTRRRIARVNGSPDVGIATFHPLGGLRLWPVPVGEGPLFVEAERRGCMTPGAHMEVLDVHGRAVLSQQVPDAMRGTIDASVLGPGTYLVRITGAQGRCTARFVR